MSNAATSGTREVAALQGPIFGRLRGSGCITQVPTMHSGLYYTCKPLHADAQSTMNSMMCSLLTGLSVLALNIELASSSRQQARNIQPRPSLHFEPEGLKKIRRDRSELTKNPGAGIQDRSQCRDRSELMKNPGAGVIKF